MTYYLLGGRMKWTGLKSLASCKGRFGETFQFNLLVIFFVVASLFPRYAKIDYQMSKYDYFTAVVPD